MVGGWVGGVGGSLKESSRGGDESWSTSGGVGRFNTAYVLRGYIVWEVTKNLYCVVLYSYVMISRNQSKCVGSR